MYLYIFRPPINTEKSIFYMLYNKLNSHAFRLVTLYDLMEERRINGVTVSFFTYLPNKTNRFHVAVCLFSNRSQVTSKCAKDISNTLVSRLVCPFFFTLCDILPTRCTATWNLLILLKVCTRVFWTEREI